LDTKDIDMKDIVKKCLVPFIRKIKKVLNMT
jgi:hypothetical protein